MEPGRRWQSGFAFEGRAAPDRARTRSTESRLAFGGADEDESAEEIATPTRQFSVRETTSGLPDDSREEDEQREARRLRDLRGRVKAARAVVSTALGLSAILHADWKRAARFYARFGITELLFRNGVPDATADGSDDFFGTDVDGMNEWK